MHIQHRKPLGRIHSAAPFARRLFLVLTAFLVSTTLLMQSVQAAAGNYSWQAATAAGLRGWISVASSSDGTKLVAGDYNTGYLYTSTDSGATWTERTAAGSRSWTSIASSSDGTGLVAGVNSGYLYLGTAVTFDTDSTTINVEVEPTISITTGGTVAITLAPTAGGVVSSASDTVSVSTNDSAGYNLAFSAVDATANLTNGGNTITPGSGTWATPATLTNNTWGYMIPGLGTTSPAATVLKLTTPPAVPPGRQSPAVGQPKLSNPPVPIASTTPRSFGTAFVPTAANRAAPTMAL